MKLRAGLMAFALAWGMSARARAVEISGPDPLPPLQVHGFVSPGFILTTSNNYLAKSKRGSFEFSEVGINFTMQLTDRLRTGVQLFAQDLGPNGTYTARLDWYYLDYKFWDWLGLRAGRVKIPYGLYNDTADIDAARVPVLLPQSVYPLNNRDFLLAQTGAEVYGRANLRAAGALEYRFYFGTIYLNPSQQSSVATPITDVDIPFVVGQRLMWETPVDGLRLGGSLQALRLDLDFLYQNKPVSIGLPATLSVGSIEYAANDLLIAAEYSRWYTRIESLSALVPRRTSVAERGYVMASYRFAPWFQPGVYYSLFYPNVHARSGPAASQHDVALTLRFDLNDHWLVKLEGHYMNGTAGLSAALNDGHAPTTLERSWGAFLVKTTAHF